MNTVSVVIPVYNCEKYIEEAVNSVLGQSYSIAEVIVINDGSTDSSQYIVEKIITNNPDKNITIHFQKNAGHATAVNNGIKMCSSKWIALLDSDDYWESDKIENQFKYIDNNQGTGIVCCTYEVVDKDSVVFQKPTLAEIPSDHTTKELIETGNFIHSSNSGVLALKSLFEEHNYFDNNLLACEDWDLWIRMSQNTKIGFCREAKSYIRMHGENQSGDKKLMFLYTLDVLKKNKGIIKNLELDLTTVITNHLINYGKTGLFIVLLPSFREVKNKTKILVEDNLYFYKNGIKILSTIVFNFLNRAVKK